MSEAAVDRMVELAEEGLRQADIAAQLHQEGLTPEPYTESVITRALKREEKRRGALVRRRKRQPRAELTLPPEVEVIAERVLELVAQRMPAVVRRNQAALAVDLDRARTLDGAREAMREQSGTLLWTLLDVATDRTARPGERTAAAVKGLEFAWGKPGRQPDGDGDVPQDVLDKPVADRLRYVRERRARLKLLEQAWEREAAEEEGAAE